MEISGSSHEIMIISGVIKKKMSNQWEIPELSKYVEHTVEKISWGGTASHGILKGSERSKFWPWPKHWGQALPVL